MCSDRSGITWRRRLRVGCQTLAAACFIIAPPTAALTAETSDDGFEERVRNYLLANPEVIFEALEVLSQREARAVMAKKIAQHPDLFAEPPVLGLGPKAATTTVIEFFDYRCVPCKVLHPKLKAALEAHPDVRVEMRHLPILSPGSERGARFVLAVRNVAGAEASAAVHEDVWTLKGPLREAAFQRIAQKHGLDWDAVQSEMSSSAVSERIDRNRDIAIDLEILGTPAFVTPTSVSFGQSDAAILVEDWLNQ